MEQVIDSDLISDRAKLALVYASEAASARGFIIELLDAMDREDLANFAPDTSESSWLKRELDDVAKSDPDLAYIYRQTFATALFASALRWPETEDKVRSIFDVATATPRREAATIVKAMESAPRAVGPRQVLTPAHC